MKIHVALLLLLLLGNLILPLVANPFVLNVLSLAYVLAILATSVNLAGGYSGLLPLGHAGIMAAAAYGTGIASTQLGFGFVGQIVAGVGVALLASVLFGLMVMRTTGIQFLMATLAQGMIVWGLALRMYNITNGENGIKGIERPPWFDGDISFFYFSLGALILAIALTWLVTRSTFGLALRGLKDSEIRLNMIGYNPAAVKFYSFVLSGIVAGLSGILFAYYNRFVAPDAAGFVVSGKSVLMVILGGAGTLLGPVIGAVIITFVENFVSGYVTRWPTVLGIMFILAVLFARQGILGALDGIARRVAGAVGGGGKSATQTRQHVRLHLDAQSSRTQSPEQDGPAGEIPL